MYQAANLVSLDQGLSLLCKHSPQSLPQQGRLFKILETSDGALQHHEADFKHINGALLLGCVLVKSAAHEVLLSGVKLHGT